MDKTTLEERTVQLVTETNEWLTQKEKEWGTPVAIANFVRFGLGEGIEKAESDFADEVAQMAGNK